METVPQTQLDQKLQLLAGQDALPVQYAAGNAPSLTVSLERSKNVLDLDRALADLGVNDEIEPAALSTIKSLYGGKFSVLPYEYNIEASGTTRNCSRPTASRCRPPGTSSWPRPRS